MRDSGLLIVANAPAAAPAAPLAAGPLSYVAFAIAIAILQGLLIFLLARKRAGLASGIVLALLLAAELALATWFYMHGSTTERTIIVLMAVLLVASACIGWMAPRRNRSAGFKVSFWLSIGALAASLLAAWGSQDVIRRFAEARAYEAQKRALLQREEMDARSCVVELAARHPEADAGADVSRGDVTPIGLTYTPHDPPDPETHYIEACEHGYEGYQRATGKWFRHTSDGFTHRGRPPSFWTCRKEARKYVIRYNRRMTILAPKAVRDFCTSQKLSRSTRINMASIAVLGTGGDKREVIDGRVYETEAATVIDTSFGPVLVTQSYRPTASAHSRKLPMGIGAAYLSEDRQRIASQRRWPLVVSRGAEEGGVALSWGDHLTSYPALYIRDWTIEGSSQCAWTTMVELRPNGPLVRGRIYHFPEKGSGARPRFSEGRIENIVRDRSFDVVEFGTDVRHHYRLQGDRLIGPPTRRLTC